MTNFMNNKNEKEYSFNSIINNNNNNNNNDNDKIMIK